MTSVQNAVAKQQEQRDNSPAALIRQYSNDFASVLPTHIKPETWVRVAQGALKKGRKVAGTDRFELEAAALNNPPAFLAALLEAARLGLEPGTEQYYLTPRKVGGRLEILGIVGYQGYIELMYRAGAISSVVAEVVRTGDRFAYKPGQPTPDHEINWDAEDRGDLRLVYAYARMKDGATSRVVVLNKTDIERIKKSSQGADGQYSPWVNHEEAMWLKSAVRQLQKWVPTSAEYIREQARAVREATGGGEVAAAFVPGPERPAMPGVDVVTGEVLDSPQEPAQPAQKGRVRTRGGQQHPPADDDPWQGGDA